MTDRQAQLLEEFRARIGQETAPSDWFEITQDGIDRFADATGDHQWIHVDVDRAEKEMGGTIAHGMLILSLLLGPLGAGEKVPGVRRTLHYGYDKVRFISAVPVGARIRGGAKLVAAEPKAGGVVFTRACTVEIEGQEKPALVADMIGVSFAD